jgi:hypothetical protein
MPVSSLASRSAVCTGPSSPGSAAPPGNAAWPAWWRSVEARTVSSKSASAGKPPDSTVASSGRPPDGESGGPENSTSTAASRFSPVIAALVLAAVTSASTSGGTRLR